MTWNFIDDVVWNPRSIRRKVAPVAEMASDLATADMAREWPRVKAIQEAFETKGRRLRR